jgi:hypothetical protein
MEDVFDSFVALGCLVVPFPHIGNKGNEGKDIRFCQGRETVLVPVFMPAVLPDPGKGGLEPGMFLLRKRLPPGIRRPADSLQGLLNRLVPEEEIPPPPQVVLRVVGHTGFLDLYRLELIKLPARSPRSGLPPAKYMAAEEADTSLVTKRDGGHGAMPDISQADIGRRMYQLHKEKSVERAIELLRHNLGADWKTLTDADILLLEQLIGDVWVGFDRKLWEKIPFDRMTRGEVDTVLAAGKNMIIDKTPKSQVIDQVRNVLIAIR